MTTDRQMSTWPKAGTFAEMVELRYIEAAARPSTPHCCAWLIIPDHCHVRRAVPLKVTQPKGHCSLLVTTNRLTIRRLLTIFSRDISMATVFCRCGTVSAPDEPMRSTLVLAATSLSRLVIFGKATKLGESALAMKPKCQSFLAAEKIWQVGDLLGWRFH